MIGPGIHLRLVQGSRTDLTVMAVTQWVSRANTRESSRRLSVGLRIFAMGLDPSLLILAMPGCSSFFKKATVEPEVVEMHPIRMEWERVIAKKSTTI